MSTDIQTPTQTQTALSLYEADGELRVLDVDLGRRLEFSDPVAIRKLIKSNSEKLNKISVLYAAEKTSPTGGRPATEYYLTQRQAIFVCMKSQTEKAFDVQMEITEVYDQYLKGRKPQLPQTYLEALKALVVSEEEKLKIEAKNRALEQRIETDKPYANLGKVVSKEEARTRREWIALMKSEEGLKVGEKKVNQWLRDQKMIYDDLLTRETRAYAQYSDWFTLSYETLNGFRRPVLKITGRGMLELTPRVLAEFS